MALCARPRRAFNGAMHVAQINIARAVAPLESETMAGFRNRLAEINAIADRSPGFVWRMIGNGGDPAGYLRAYDDDRMVINISVWSSLAALRDFVYRTSHTEMIRGRAAWFERPSAPISACWWIEPGTTPTIAEAVARLEHLRTHGESAHAFTLNYKGEPPMNTATPESAAEHFRHQLSFTTDAADVAEALQNASREILVIDARTSEWYAKSHIPGAISFPHRTMNEQTVAALPKDRVMVVYCDGIGCNASTKGAMKLATLGFRVKELLGGLDWWIRDGHPIATGEAETVEAAVAVRCGC